MKIPIAVTAAIIAVAAGIAWSDYRNLSAARRNHDQVMARAADRGISLDSGNRIRITRHSRENQVVEARLFAAEFLGLIRKAVERTPSGESPDADLAASYKAFFERERSLNVEQLMTVIAECLNARDLKEDLRRLHANSFATAIAQRDPKAFLRLVSNSAVAAEIMGDGLEFSTRASLAVLAKEDLTGAVEWIQRNEGNFPESKRDSLKYAVLGSIAGENPEAAFQMIDSLGCASKGTAVEVILGSRIAARQRTAMLSAFRHHLASMGDSEVRDRMWLEGLVTLTNEAAREGVEGVDQWLAEAELSPKEMGKVADDMSMPPVSDPSPGKWIEWISGHASTPKVAADRVRFLVRRWTENDHQAAATWLDNTPDSPVKSIAIGSFAAIAAKYEPETAARWALTIPAGADRDEALKSVYTHWPRKSEEDKAAAEAFKVEHGIR